MSETGYRSHFAYMDEIKAAESPQEGVTRRFVQNCWGGRPHGIECQNWGCEQPRPEPSMTQYRRIGIDTSKAVFTLHGIDQQDRMGVLTVRF